MANEKTTAQNLNHLLGKLDELELLGESVESITIKPTSQDLKRHEEVCKFISALNEAHERTAQSTLRFYAPVYSAA